jgi:type IV secretory pathway VirJ component
MNPMKFKHTFTGRLLTGLLVMALPVGLALFAAHKNFPVVRDVLTSDVFGSLTVARPLISFQNLVVVFTDTKKYRADDLAHRIAQAGDAVAIVDTARAMHTLTGSKNKCLSADRVMEPAGILAKWAHASKDKHAILAGIEEGGLLPFLSALTKSSNALQNLSVGFSVKIPDGIELCSPLTSELKKGQRILTSSPPLQGKWLTAWTDEPETDTALFVRSLTGAQTVIEPYHTPFDVVTVNQIKKIRTDTSHTVANSFPVVEIPAKNPNETLTLFYSGDGGWRDLDRTVAGMMAERGYPVVGVDTLRAFWSSRTPEKSADDLAAIMAYYRTTWKAKKFVLAGYSFGADIIPAIYNRLSETDRESVALLVLLALGKTADFEIHISGWIGKNNTGLPILPELNRIQGNKIFCIFGQEEKADSACTALPTPGAKLLELPGGHHFDQDYQKLTMRIIDMYQQAGLPGSN